jgi:hypothetical protein
MSPGTNFADEPITVENLRAAYPATRLVFKARKDDKLFLYYNNRSASVPHYDIDLLSGELLAADKSAPTLGPEEQLHKVPGAAQSPSATGGILFWAVLAAVVIGLLALIARLLPKPSNPV